MRGPQTGAYRTTAPEIRPCRRSSAARGSGGSGLEIEDESTTDCWTVGGQRGYEIRTGEVREADVAGGDEKLELVRIVKP